MADRKLTDDELLEELQQALIEDTPLTTQTLHEDWG